MYFNKKEKKLLGYDYVDKKPDCKEKGFVSYKRKTITQNLNAYKTRLNFNFRFNKD